jgi:acetyltransferase-like isoleucine patch superfamily enzyme
MDLKHLRLGFLQFLFTLMMYVLAILIMALAIYPGVVICFYVWLKTVDYALFLRIFLFCLSLTTAYFLYGFVLIFLTGIIRIIFRLNLKEGEYRIASLGMARWAFINALYLLISITFMDFVLLTPLASLVFRLMGAKVGRNVQINSKICADLSLLEIGDDAVIGGHATVICHSFERGRLILKKVKIGKRAIIGLNAVVLPGAEKGDGALVAAGAIVGKNVKVAAHSVYAQKDRL